MARHRFYLNPNSSMEVSFGGTKASAVQRMREHCKRLKNVEMGFYDQKGTFHPIRASSDYSSGRAGEGRRKKKSRKRKSRRRR